MQEAAQSNECLKLTCNATQGTTLQCITPTSQSAQPPLAPALRAQRTVPPCAKSVLAVERLFAHACGCSCIMAAFEEVGVCPELIKAVEELDWT
jgi:hypothetical protein